jgi:hypothetical protein
VNTLDDILEYNGVSGWGILANSVIEGYLMVIALLTQYQTVYDNGTF